MTKAEEKLVKEINGFISELWSYDHDYGVKDVLGYIHDDAHILVKIVQDYVLDCE